MYVIEVDNVEVKLKISNPSEELMNAQTVWIELPVEHIVLFDENQRRVPAEIKEKA